MKALMVCLLTNEDGHVAQTDSTSAGAAQEAKEWTLRLT